MPEDLAAQLLSGSGAVGGTESRAPPPPGPAARSISLAGLQQQPARCPAVSHDGSAAHGCPGKDGVGFEVDCTMSQAQGGQRQQQQRADGSRAPDRGRGGDIEAGHVDAAAAAAQLESAVAVAGLAAARCSAVDPGLTVAAVPPGLAVASCSGSCALRASPLPSSAPVVAAASGLAVAAVPPGLAVAAEAREAAVLRSSSSGLDAAPLQPCPSPQPPHAHHDQRGPGRLSSPGSMVVGGMGGASAGSTGAQGDWEAGSRCVEQGGSSTSGARL